MRIHDRTTHRHRSCSYRCHTHRSRGSPVRPRRSASPAVPRLAPRILAELAAERADEMDADTFSELGIRVRRTSSPSRDNEVAKHQIWAADDAHVGCSEDADAHLPVLIAGELAALGGHAHPLT